MPDLTFGEQVKIVLGRKGMTIKELAEMIEQHTNKKMSRQNLTQRLGRDNFQEQDMRMIASILECPFRLSILGEDTPDEKEIADIAVKEVQAAVVEKGKWKTDLTSYAHLSAQELHSGFLNLLFTSRDYEAGLVNMMKERYEVTSNTLQIFLYCISTPL